MLNKIFCIELRALNGASEQFNFYTSDATVRKTSDQNGQKVLPMNHTWNNKARVNEVIEKQGAHQTFSNLFTMKPNKQNPLRTQHLIDGENKGRPFNPLTGANHFNLDIRK